MRIYIERNRLVCSTFRVLSLRRVILIIAVLVRGDRKFIAFLQVMPVGVEAKRHRAEMESMKIGAASAGYSIRILFRSRSEESCIIL
jgi:hypothetical protein